MTSLGEQSFVVAAPRAGTYLTRVRFSPYWEIARGGACVGRGAGGWAYVRATRAETVEVTIGFSLERIFARGPRCD